MRRLFSSDGISPKSCSICHESAGSSTSIVKYLETATPTESKPGPILADVAGTVIFIIIHQKEESHQRLFSLIPFLYAPIRAYQLVRQNFLSALLATLIGTFGSIFIYESKQRQQTGILSLNNVLMVAPDVMIGASFLILFTLIGFQLGFVSVLLSHIAFSIPIVVLMVLPRLKEMNRDMVNAAYDLGATQWQMLREVMLPYLTPGIIAGYFMAFTYSLDDFAVTFFVTGNGFSTLAVEIYSRARKGISLEINALSTVVFLFSILLVIGYYLITKEKKEEQDA